jgi:protein ImuB
MTRRLVLWWPDWATWAAGATPGEPVAVVVAQVVVAATPSARADGVRPGVRRREAQARCPALRVVPGDPAAEARAFAPVLAALDGLTPLVEVLAVPGSCAFATRGPSRWAGGDRALAVRTAELAVATRPEAVAVLGPPRVGIADTGFAARLAAAGTAAAAGPSGPSGPAGPAPFVVEPGATAAFLAPFPIEALCDPDASAELRAFVDRCRRLGLARLGDLAALSAADVLARFGPLGAAAHRRAGGGDDRPLHVRPPDPDLTVTVELDPPAAEVATVAFAVRSAAADLHDRLAGRGLACTRLVVEAETGHGERSVRAWRQDGALRPAAMVERVRWQLDGWTPTAGVSLVRLVCDEVVADTGHQLGFWGGPTAADDAAARLTARLTGLLGPDAVLVPEAAGGRGPGEQLTLVSVEAVDLAARRSGLRPPAAGLDGPWPGRVPPPTPARVFDPPLPVELTDTAGRSVVVGARGDLAAPPHRCRIDGPGAPPLGVTAWSAPWPCEERWWDPGRHRRRARLQVVLDDGTAHLLVVERRRWFREATYD